MNYLEFLLGLLRANPGFITSLLKMLVNYLENNPDKEAWLIEEIEKRIKK